MSRLESAARLALEFNQASNRHDVAGMVRLVTDDCVFESTDPAPDGARYVGKEAVTRWWQDFFRESPHAHWVVEDIVGMGARCIARWRYDWIDAAGRKSHVRGVDLFQVRDGLISEQLSYLKGSGRPR